MKALTVHISHADEGSPSQGSGGAPPCVHRLGGRMGIKRLAFPRQGPSAIGARQGHPENLSLGRAGR